MDLNVNIQKLGNIDNIFNFYRYIIDKNELKNHTLLESRDSSPHAKHFSFLTLEPDFMIKIIQKKMEIYDVSSEQGEILKNFCENYKSDEKEAKLAFSDEVKKPLPSLEKLQNFFPTISTSIPELFPQKVFSGGLLGYIGYDILSKYVGYQPSQKMTNMFPDILMGCFSRVLAYSHQSKTLYEIQNSIKRNPINALENVVEKFKASTNYSLNMNDSFIKDNISEIHNRNPFKSNTSFEKWENMIENTKEHIFAGDVIQAVMSRKKTFDSEVKPLDVYEALRLVNPSPYMYYLNFDGAHNGDVRIIGSSPEPIITKSNTSLNTVPIAGTRRRGKNPEDEIRMEKELLNSEKELAEHIMLVDLARNDLARVSEPGTVDAYKLIELKKFPTVMHIVSQVKSTSYLSPFKILKSMFPAGTVSGAPKLRAMKMIQKYEVENRGPYAGCVGYINFTGDMDMAISIRTIFNKDKHYIAQAGAGIVADSTPQEEYIETDNKLKGVLSSINVAELYMDK